MKYDDDPDPAFDRRWDLWRATGRAHEQPVWNRASSVGLPLAAAALVMYLFIPS